MAYSCASNGNDESSSFRLNVITSSTGELKANRFEGQGTANTWVTYNAAEKTCNGGGGHCYSGESCKVLEGSSFHFSLKITDRAASNDNRTGFAATATAATAEAFDLRRPEGNQRLAFTNVPVVCEKKN